MEYKKKTTTKQRRNKKHMEQNYMRNKTKTKKNAEKIINSNWP